jgi:transposase
MIDFQKFLSDNSLPSLLVNARRMKHYIKSISVQGKTDKSDSYVIALYASTKNVDIFTIIYSVNRELLGKYSTTLRLIQKTKTQIRNLNHAMHNGIVDDSITESLLRIKKDLEREEKYLKKESQIMLIETFPVVEHLNTTFKGLGFSFLGLFIPKVYDTIDTYTTAQTIAFIGFNPVPFESGQMKMRDKLNIFGDSEIKRLLFLAVLRAVRLDDISKGRYKELLSKGKPKKVALVAVARKLLKAVIIETKKYKRENVNSIES